MRALAFALSGLAIAPGAAGADLTCWGTGLTYAECCPTAENPSGNESCWDDMYTSERCCLEQIDFSKEPPRDFLALGARFAALEAHFAQRCWPGSGPEAFRECCSIRHGLRGRPDCFESEGEFDPAFSFGGCCLMALLEGLDDCEDEWCNPEMWSPRPVFGLRHGVLDHRAFVGMERGNGWDQVGRAEFEFLRDPQGGGVTERTWFLEVACGSGRLARHLVPWLLPGRYRGLDKARMLIEQGYYFELSPQDRAHKRPRFAASEAFEFELMGGPPPNVSIAVSLITHLNAQDVRHLLSRLRRYVQPGHVFFPTYVPRRNEDANPTDSNALTAFRWTLEDMREIAAEVGWSTSDATGPWLRALNTFAPDHHRARRHSMLRLTAV